MSFTGLKEAKEETLNSISETLKSLSVDDLKTEGFTIRCGSKVLRMLVDVESDKSSIEDEIREELREKLQSRLNEISRVVKDRIDVMASYIDTLKSDYEDKIREAERRISSATLMPELNINHTKAGLSVSRYGKDDGDRLLWLFQSVYWPKYLDDKLIEPSYSKRLINHILITVETLGESVMNVNVRKPIGFSTFEHYHTNCWGAWKHPKTWKTPDDIIEIAQQAEVVLETINTGSLASRAPRGLVKVSTLRNHTIIKEEGSSDNFTSNRRSQNMGVDDNFTRDNTWSV
jgi:hypothetical protein